jgi:hypothetical protein
MFLKRGFPWGACRASAIAHGILAKIFGFMLQHVPAVYCKAAARCDIQ